MGLSTTPNSEPIPGYRLIERLGRGGYGEVWKCEAPGGIFKAIKFVYGDMEGFGDAGQAAEQEYKSLNRVKTIRHPYILSLERFDIIDGQLLIVMELADRNMWDRFNECVVQGKVGIPREELLRYMDEAAEALDLMNGHYTIQHLDIKPQNLFLVHQHIKVADFGLAKDLEGAKAAITGGVTPTYAPPETFEGWVSRHSDQYSLAIVYQEMLTGRRPFNGTNTKQLILQHLTAEPDLGSLRGSEREAIAKALSKIPTDRFATCTEFVKALRGASTTAITETTVEPTEPLGQVLTPLSTAKNLLSSKTTPPLPKTVPESNVGGKKLPSLVTPGSRPGMNSIAPVTKLRPFAPNTSSHPVTLAAPPQRSGNGVLFPMIVIGIGGTGLNVMTQMRKQLKLRFNHDRIPNIAWLGIDSDPTTTEQFLQQSRWNTDELLLTRLHRASHYMNRDGLPNVEAWLPSDRLFQIPRSHLTEGNRTFGRLVLCDHYQIICHRLRSAIEAFLKPEHMMQAEQLTKLGLRSNYPRIYLVGSIAGGTGSGMLIDLAYIIRREIRQMGFDPQQIFGILGLPSANAAEGTANANACVNELRYFSHPNHVFQANYDSREQPLVDDAAPFRRLTFLPADQPNGVSQVDRIVDVLLTEAYSEAGKLLQPDQVNASEHRLCVSTLDRCIWPHQLVQQELTNRLNRSILSDWSQSDQNYAHPHLDQLLDKIWDEKQLDPTALSSLIYGSLTEHYQQTPNDLIANKLSNFVDTLEPNGTSNENAIRLIQDVLSLVGKVGREEAESPGEFVAVMAKRHNEWISETETKFITTVVALIEQPGFRLPAASKFINQFENKLSEHLGEAEYRITRLEERVRDDYSRLFSILGLTNSSLNRVRKRNHEEANIKQSVSQWVEAKIEVLVARQLISFYRMLKTNLPEYLREVQLCRTQLLKYRDLIPERLLDPRVNQNRYYWGDTNDSLEQLLQQLLNTITPAMRVELDNILQAKIRHEGRGLVNMCVKAKDFQEKFLTILTEQTTKLLDPLLRQYRSLAVTWNPLERGLIHELFESSSKQFAVLPTVGNPVLTLMGFPKDNQTEELENQAKNAAAGSAFASDRTGDEIWLYRECRLQDGQQLFEQQQPAGTSLTSDSRLRHARTDILWPKS